MNKIFKSMMAISMAAISAFGLVACGENGDNGGSRNDGTKSEILVYNYAGGVGSVWLDKAIARFEEKFADYSFEEGKTGVVIEKNATKSGADLAAIQNASEDVFFSEWIDIPSLIAQGKVLNINDVVTTPLNTYLEGRTTDTETIQDKLYAETVDFFTFKNEEYYGLPHYSTMPTLTYNKKLFDDKGLYFAKTPSSNDLLGKFISASNPTKSCGPDGVCGNADDGLPATWDEMYDLFEYMGKKSTTPIIYSGAAAYGYTKYLLNNAYVNLVGKDVARYNYTFDSSDNMINVVTGWESTSNTAKPTTGTAKVTPSDTSALNKQLEKYQALEILDKILDTDKWQHDVCDDSEATALDAQFEFINSYNENKPVGILMEGNYWYNESEDALYFEDVRANYDNYDELNDYQIMPMPRGYSGTAADIDGTQQRKTVVTDQADSFACINAKIAGNAIKVKIAKMFLAFCYTEESLAEFTETTNVLRYMHYDVDESKLTNYGKSVYNYVKNSEILFPYSSHVNYIGDKMNYSLHLESSFWEYTNSGTPYNALNGSNKYVKTFFNGYMNR